MKRTIYPLLLTLGSLGFASLARSYPNPATDVLSIQRPASVDAATELTVRAYDLRGAEVHGLTLADDQLRIGTLSQGVYLLTIGAGASTSHQRLVKQ